MNVLNHNIKRKECVCLGFYKYHTSNKHENKDNYINDAYNNLKF